MLKSVDIQINWEAFVQKSFKLINLFYRRHLGFPHLGEDLRVHGGQWDE